jgi:hypothetical protein
VAKRITKTTAGAVKGFRVKTAALPCTILYCSPKEGGALNG